MDLLSFLPSLSTGEVFAFGEGVALPTRLRFKELPAKLLPKSEAVSSENGLDLRIDGSQSSMAAIVDRWRGLSSQQKPSFDKPREAPASVYPSEVRQSSVPRSTVATRP